MTEQVGPTTSWVYPGDPLGPVRYLSLDASDDRLPIALVWGSEIEDRCGFLGVKSRYCASAFAGRRMLPALDAARRRGASTVDAMHTAAAAGANARSVVSDLHDAASLGEVRAYAATVYVPGGMPSPDDVELFPVGGPSYDETTDGAVRYAPVVSDDSVLLGWLWAATTAQAAGLLATPVPNAETRTEQWRTELSRHFIFGEPALTAVERIAELGPPYQRVVAPFRDAASLAAVRENVRQQQA
jgi:hypothetical protein